MSKEDKTTTKPKASVTNVRKGVPIHGLWGILALIVAVSVMYANYRVFFGTDDILSRVMLLPSTLAVVSFLVYKALK